MSWYTHNIHVHSHNVTQEMSIMLPLQARSALGAETQRLCDSHIEAIPGQLGYASLKLKRIGSIDYIKDNKLQM